MNGREAGFVFNEFGLFNAFLLALREARGAASPSGSGARAGKGAGGSSGFDACASELDRHVATLDHVYRGGARFRALRDRHGADPGSWPAASLAEVAVNRNRRDACVS